MEFQELLDLVGDEPVFETALLLAGEVDPDSVRQQLTRWTNSGRIYQIRRGVYALRPPFQKTRPHPFIVANHLQHASYVSLQTALAFYGLIPEWTPVTTSLTAGRPERLETPVGAFEYRHVRSGLLRGYRSVDLNGRSALVARPEKALLDLVYLTPDGDDPRYLAELRLQNLELLDPGRVEQQAAIFDSKKIARAVSVLNQMIKTGAEEYVTL